MKLAELLREAEIYCGSKAKPKPSTKPKPPVKISETLSLLDRPLAIQHSWEPSEDRGPSAQEKFKRDRMQPLPENIVEVLDFAAYKLSRGWA